MSETGWRFLQVRREAVSQDPTQHEFFAPEEGTAGALVRETIQNSLDARSGGAPVVVRFHFGGDDSTTFSSSPYFAVLRDHLGVQLKVLPANTESISYLVVEDFGTRGLQGDPSHTIYDEGEGKAERNDFFYFWRNVGRSRKEETERGRWGLGKTVFPASSKVSSFFGVTVRNSDGRQLLMGQCVGVTHTMFGSNGEKTIYEPYGYFARFEEESPLALPIENPHMLNHFRSQFSVSRVDEPGLSIIVPFPSRDLNPDILAREAIRSYYVPILTGELKIISSNPTTCFEITKESIREVTAKLKWSDGDTPAGMLGLLDFAEKALAVRDEDFVVLHPQHDTKAPELSRERIPDDRFEELQQLFETGNMVTVRVPTLVKKKQGDQPSNFDLFLQRDETLRSGIGEFVREGLAITQTGKPPRVPARGLALVRDKPLSTLLGDSENPAHTKWQEKAEKVKTRYTSGLMTVRLVNNSLSRLAEHLTFRPEVRDLNLLSEVFFLPRSENDTPRKGTLPGDKSGDDTVPPPPMPPAKPRPFRLESTAGGFRIVANPMDERQLERIDVEVAYAVRTGNPFKRFRPFDFDLSKMHFRREGIEINAITANRLSLRVTSKTFDLSVSGFDPRRDLEVNAVPTFAEGEE